jgi:hypothetical protein
LSESRFPDLLETLAVEVIERVGGDESGASQAGALPLSLRQQSSARLGLKQKREWNAIQGFEGEAAKSNGKDQSDSKTASP